MLSIREYIKHPRLLGISMLRSSGKWLPDKFYVKLMYRLQMGYRLDLKAPKRFTEKLQWLKLFDHNPLYTVLVDKYAVKEWVAKMIGDEYVIPTLGVWNSIDSVDWDSLPNQFVLKTTFGGGSDGVYICDNKALLDKHMVTRRFERSMRTDPYSRLREWPYKNVPRRIIAEKYMEDKSGDLADYKFYCFGGEPKVLLIATNRYTTHNFDYFDMEFQKLPIVSAMGKNSPDFSIKKPLRFDEMKEIARKLSRGLHHVRVDLYYCNDRIFFGEMTLYDSSGLDDMNSEEWNMRFGSWISLPGID